VVKIAGWAVLAIIGGIGFLYLRLMYGPIALNFLAGPIERAVLPKIGR